MRLNFRENNEAYVYFLVLSSTHFGQRDNLKIFDSIVTVKTLVGSNILPAAVLRKREAQYGHIQFLPKLS